MKISRKTRQIIEEDIGFKRDDLISPSLARITRWIKKSDRSKDEFDKYLAIFIAFNMFYNLWHKLRYPSKEEMYQSDSAKMQQTINLMNLDENIPIDRKDITKLMDILTRDRLLCKIYKTIPDPSKPGKRKRILDGLAQELLTKYPENNERTMCYLLKSLYKIRCNLVHGEKAYVDGQRRLLKQSTIILKRILVYLIDQLKDLVRMPQNN